MKVIGLTTLLGIMNQKSDIGRHSKVASFFAKNSKPYDFYKELKYSAKGYASGSHSMDDVLKRCSGITKKVERDHNIKMIKSFDKWWSELSGVELVKDSPPEKFLDLRGFPVPVRFRPELRMVQGGRDKIIYLWASKDSLDKTVAARGLVLLRDAYKGDDFKDVEYYILDVRTKRIFGEDLIDNRTHIVLNASMLMIAALWNECSNN